MQHVDIWLFKQINTGLANPALDGVMLAASALGAGAAQAVLSLALVLLGWLGRRVDLRRAGYAGAMACAAGGIGAQLAKAIWCRPRPLATLYEARAVGAPLFGGSFPSGHATTAFAVAVAVSAFVPWSRYVLIPLATVISLSRVYVGAHFPLDVVYGAALGTLIGMACARMVRTSPQPSPDRGGSGTSPRPSPDRRGGGPGEASGQEATAKHTAGPYAVLLALCLVLFMWRLGAVPLMGLDEGLYASCAREMAAGGSWIVPTVSGQPFFDKPPLAYWLMAASIRAFGTNSFAARLPSSLAALGLVALTAFLGTRLFGRRAGLLAGFALAASMLTAGLARMALLDMLFALVITVALGSFLLAYLGLLPRWGYLIFWAAAGLAMLVKGPAGVVLIGVTVGAYLLIRKQPKTVLKMLPLAGIVMFVLVAAPWYVLVQRETGGEFLREFIIHQNLQRALGKDFSHNMPFYFYLPTYLIGFFPWSVFVPLAWVRHVSRRPADPAGEASLFAGVWIAVMVVIFSISRSKLPAYIYPVYPASALLIGRLWSDAVETGAIDSLRRYAIAAAVLAAVVGAALIAGPVFLPQPIPGLGTALSAMALSLLAGTVVCLALLIRRRPGPAFIALCGGTAAFVLAAILLGMPIAARSVAEAAVAVAAELRRVAPPSVPVFAYRLSPPQATLPFYAERSVITEKEPGNLRPAVSTRGVGAFLVVAQDDRLEDLPRGGKLVWRRGRYMIYRFAGTGARLRSP